MIDLKGLLWAKLRHGWDSQRSIHGKILDLYCESRTTSTSPPWNGQQRLIHSWN